MYLKKGNCDIFPAVFTLKKNNFTFKIGTNETWQTIEGGAHSNDFCYDNLILNSTIIGNCFAQTNNCLMLKLYYSPTWEN